MCYSQPGSGGAEAGGGVLIYGPAITCDTHRAASGDVSLLLTEEKKKSQLILRGAGGRRDRDADEREFQEGGIGSWGH